MRKDPDCQKNRMRVSWFLLKKEWVVFSHHFPDKHGGEPLIKTEEEAWRLANRFASATGNDIVNIYVVDSQWSPVKDYNLKRIRKY